MALGERVPFTLLGLTTSPWSEPSGDRLPCRGLYTSVISQVVRPMAHPTLLGDPGESGFGKADVPVTVRRYKATRYPPFSLLASKLHSFLGSLSHLFKSALVLSTYQ